MLWYLVRWDGNTPLNIVIHYASDDVAVSYPYDSEFVDLLEIFVTEHGGYRFTNYGQDYGDLWSHGAARVTCTRCENRSDRFDDLSHWRGELLCYTCYNGEFQCL